MVRFADEHEQREVGNDDLLRPFLPFGGRDMNRSSSLEVGHGDQGNSSNAPPRRTLPDPGEYWPFVENFARFLFAHSNKLPKILTLFVMVGLTVLTGEEIAEHSQDLGQHQPQRPQQQQQQSQQTRPLKPWAAAGSAPASVVREERIIDCASRLSSNVPNVSFDDVRRRAADWFVGGAGAEFEAVPASSKDCAWDTSFGQTYALLVLRESLLTNKPSINPSWFRTDLPVTGLSHVCRWHRVACDGNGERVTKLHLADAGLTGELPPELTVGLTSLTRLELYDNVGLTGSLPPELSSLTELEYLELHHTSLQGTVPADLASLKELRQLFIDDTLLRGDVPKGVCELRSLHLEEAHADCKGTTPRVRCDCCTKCYAFRDRPTTKTTTTTATVTVTADT